MDVAIYVLSPWTLEVLDMKGEKSKTAAKWGEALTKSGFTVIPNQLISYNQYAEEGARISPTEFYLLCQLLVHWWEASDRPFPSKASLSERTGLSTRQIQRTLGSLEEKGLILRIARFGRNSSGRMSNAYDLQPLVRRLQEFQRKSGTRSRNK